jgi:hypothetical protein
VVKRLGAEEDDEEGVEEEEAEVDSPAAIRRRQLAALQVCVRMLSFFCPFFFLRQDAISNKDKHIP